MILSKIDFINLLPFNIFLKKFIKSTQIKQIINYKKSYPSKINNSFKKRKIDAGFLSSIVTRKYNCTNLGIVSSGKVLSVLLIKGKNKKDYQSNTSNILADILKLDGEVIIGDKALQYYYSNYNNNSSKVIDLSEEWKNKYNLPFVFAIFCFQKHNKYFLNISDKFLKSNIKIPYYILNQYSKKYNLTNKQIKYYLENIYYKIGHKEIKSLKLFFKLYNKIKH